jgi:hypothetical protein
MFSTREIVAIITLLAVVVSGVALAQMTPSEHPMLTTRWGRARCRR